MKTELGIKEFKSIINSKIKIVALDMVSITSYIHDFMSLHQCQTISFILIIINILIEQRRLRIKCK